MADPLGISTGQGQGEAQVFGNTYNDYYAKKADEGAAKKAEIEQGLASISGGVWDRDLGIFKPMLEDVRKYVQDNARAIINGDFDANIGWNRKKNEVAQLITSSMAAKKFHDSNLALLNDNPNKYSDFSKKQLLDYGNTPGRFDNGIFLESKFNPKESLDAMRDALGKVQYSSIGGVKEITLPSGKKYAAETLQQRKEAAKAILDSQINVDKENSPGQAEAFWTQEEYDTQLSALENSLGSKTNFKQQGDYNKETSGVRSKKEAAHRRKNFIANVKDNPELVQEELSNLVGRYNPKRKANLLETVVLNPGEEGVKNKTVKIVYEGLDPIYIDTEQKGYMKRFNTEISNLSGMDNLDDNDLSLIPDVEMTPSEGTNVLKTESLMSLLYGDDLDEKFGSFTDKNKLTKAVKDEALRSEISNVISPDKTFFSGVSQPLSTLITDNVKGNDYKGGKVVSVEYNSETIGADLYSVTYTDKDGQTKVVEIESTDKPALEELLGINSVTSEDKEKTEDNKEKTSGKKKTKSAAERAAELKAKTQK